MSQRAARHIARGIWALTLLILPAAVVFEALNRDTTTKTPRPDGVEAVATLIGWMALYVTFLSVGTLVITRQPSNVIGWLFCWFSVGGCIVILADAYVLYALVTEPGAIPGGSVAAWLGSLFAEALLFPELALFFLLFPRGHPPAGRWRLLLLGTLTGGLFLVIASFEPGTLAYYPLEDDMTMRNPLGIEIAGGALGVLGVAGQAIAVPVLLGSVVSFFIRFRRARGVERQQLKWVVFAGAFVLTTWVTLPLVGWVAGIPEEVFNFLVLPAFLSIPIATGIAILRHNLYDIDRLINRTLVYGLLSAILGSMYLALILFANAVIVGRSGELPDIAIAGSTLFVAAMFRPVQRRVQGVVDRRFFRSKYDASRTIELFAVRLREEVDLDTLAGDLRAVVQETMQPAYISLWLRPAPEQVAR